MQNGRRVHYMAGRYYAVLSMVPYLLFLFVLFFAICFFLVWFLQDFDFEESFDTVVLPFLLAGSVFMPFVLVFLFILRWHGKRRIVMAPDGLTMVLPNGREIYIPWQFVVAVELRFSKPKTVQCTLVTPALRFTFTNLDINLEERQPLHLIFKKSFSLDSLRELLYYLHHMAPHLSWRLGQSFKEQFHVHYPPYDLEKMKDEF